MLLKGQPGVSRVKSLTRSSRGGQRALSELGAELMERRASQGGEGKALDLPLRSDYPCPPRSHDGFAGGPQSGRI